jgi:hypothetical protein
LDWLGQAFALEQVETVVADTATVLLPILAVLKHADAVDQIVVRAAVAALLILVGKTPIDGACALFQTITSLAVAADSPCVFQTASLHFLARALLSHEIIAFAGVAPEIVIS